MTILPRRSVNRSLINAFTISLCLVFSHSIFIYYIGTLSAMLLWKWGICIVSLDPHDRLSYLPIFLSALSQISENIWMTLEKVLLYYQPSDVNCVIVGTLLKYNENQFSVCVWRGMGDKVGGHLGGNGKTNYFSSLAIVAGNLNKN